MNSSQLVARIEALERRKLDAEMEDTSSHRPYQTEQHGSDVQPVKDDIESIRSDLMSALKFSIASLQHVSVK